jgi:hypothetical protein
MSLPISPSQNQLLWLLAVKGGKAWLSQLNPGHQKVAGRSQLKLTGFIVEDKEKDPVTRRNKIALTLTPKAWEYLISYPSLGTNCTAQILNIVLERLNKLLELQNISLINFFTNQNYQEVYKTEPELVWKLLVNIKAKQNTREVSLKLSEVRKAANIQRQALDEALIELHRQGKLILVPVDDPSNLKKEDHQAALKLKGELMHQILLNY